MNISVIRNEPLIKHIRCNFNGCDKTTFYNKAFCTEHVENNVYAKHVISSIVGRENEIKLLSKRRSTLNADSTIVKETLILIAEKSYTASRLAKKLRISVANATNLMQKMVNLKLAKKDRTRRNKLRISNLESSLNRRRKLNPALLTLD